MTETHFCHLCSPISIIQISLGLLAVISEHLNTTTHQGSAGQLIYDASPIFIQKPSNCFELLGSEKENKCTQTVQYYPLLTISDVMLSDEKVAKAELENISLLPLQLIASPVHHVVMPLCTPMKSLQSCHCLPAVYCISTIQKYRNNANNNCVF